MNQKLLSELSKDEPWHQRMTFWVLDWVIFLPSTLVRRRSKPVRFAVVVISLPWVLVSVVVTSPVFLLSLLMLLWEAA